MTRKPDSFRQYVEACIRGLRGHTITEYEFAHSILAAAQGKLPGVLLPTHRPSKRRRDEDSRETTGCCR